LFGTAAVGLIHLPYLHFDPSLNFRN